MKRAKGFTLVELVIVIVIVGILSIVAVPIYRGYTRKAMASEGKSLLGTIQTSQKVYFAEYAEYLAVGATGFNEQLDVDARSNKYFTRFTVTTNGKTGEGAQFVASTTGTGGASGISLTLVGNSQAVPTFIDQGLNA